MANSPTMIMAAKGTHSLPMPGLADDRFQLFLGNQIAANRP